MISIRKSEMNFYDIYRRVIVTHILSQILYLTPHSQNPHSAKAESRSKSRTSASTALRSLAFEVGTQVFRAGKLKFGWN